MYMYMYMYILTIEKALPPLHTYIYMHVHIYIYTHICMYVYKYTCIHIYTHTLYTYTNIYIYMYIHILTYIEYSVNRGSKALARCNILLQHTATHCCNTCNIYVHTLAFLTIERTRPSHETAESTHDSNIHPPKKKNRRIAWQILQNCIKKLMC